MLVFAGISPHPPILIPTIGKKNLKKIKKTEEALEKMEENLYSTYPETIIIISPHGSLFNDAFTINVCSEYSTDLKEFGDLSTTLKFKGDLEVGHHIRTTAKSEKIPAVMINEEKMDHGSIVPLFYLTKHLPEIKIVQIGFSNLDNKTHFDFGRLIKEEIMKSQKRIAVIASGDMSHALTTQSPAGFNSDGQKFDDKIKELFMSKNLSGLAQIDKNMIKNAGECGFRSFLILAGIIQQTNFTYHELSYEAPFGVGYLVAEFEL